MSDAQLRTITAAPLRAVHPLPTTARSPERQRLAAAIERRAAANEMLDRIRQARPAAWDAINEAEAALAEWERALREAREDEPRNTVAIALGDTPSGPSVAAATAGLDATLAELEDRRAISVALSAREREVQDDLSAAERAIKTAVGEVIRTDPNAIRLVAEYTAARDRLATLDLVFSAMIKAAQASPDGAIDVVGVRDGTPEYYAARSAEAAPWERAVTALFNDPDAPLPDSIEPGEPPRAA